jgi:hypothetical protein
VAEAAAAAITGKAISALHRCTSRRNLDSSLSDTLTALPMRTTRSCFRAMAFRQYGILVLVASEISFNGYSFSKAYPPDRLGRDTAYRFIA